MAIQVKFNTPRTDDTLELLKWYNRLTSLLNHVIIGTGDPEGVIPAKVGTLFLREDGGASTVLYVKETGSDGPTGWVAK